jgi:hypothetical protein
VSQHIFFPFHNQSQCKVRVQIGWDRPLQVYYMVVMKADLESLPDDDEGVIYSNLYDTDNPTEIAQFRAIAERLGLAVPDVIWRNAYADSERNIVNRTVFYDLAGNEVAEDSN